MTKRRATIARRLVEAQRTAAMLTTFNEVDMSAVMDLRERRKEAFQKKHGVGLGIASFFVKAAVGALKAFPAHQRRDPGRRDRLQALLRHRHGGRRRGRPGRAGAARRRRRCRSPTSSAASATSPTRAGNGTLTLDDLKGGTFTITNGGVFGSLMSTPILNPPQVGILGLHKIADRAVPVNGQVVIRPMMYLALSYDHRLVDGREAVQFLVQGQGLHRGPGVAAARGLANTGCARSAVRSPRLRPEGPRPVEPTATILLHAWRGGEASPSTAAAARLRGTGAALRARALRSERADHTLQTRALVHEAYLRLVDADVSWQDKAHFMAVAARTMRRVLVDHARGRRRAEARRRRRQGRAGGRRRCRAGAVGRRPRPARRARAAGGVRPAQGRRSSSCTSSAA